MISDAFKQDLLHRADIVDVISRRVELKRRGRDFYGLCPFHDEDTPSFSVSPTKQFYYCHGCGHHGNAIDFVMAYTGRGFRESVKELASEVGMQVPDDKEPSDPLKVKLDQENRAAAGILHMLEPELYIVAVCVADALAGRTPSEEDKSRYYLAVARIMRGIETSKRRKLTEAERRHILGEEYKEQLEKEFA